MIQNALSVLPDDAEPEQRAAMLERLGWYRWSAGDVRGSGDAHRKAVEIVADQPASLAQAVALNAYEWRMAVDSAPPADFRQPSPPATQAELIGLYEHLEHDLDAAGFFHPPAKKPSMVTNLRVIFARAGLTEQEVRTLRGVVTALSKGRGRVLAKLAAQKSERAGE